MMRRYVMLAALACTSLVSALGIGDQAPGLDGVTLIKGSMPDLSAQWTAVEFWATWCGPCRRSIPHLTQLQALHGEDIAIVGLSNEKEKTVREFVDKQGENMAYTVGLVPPETRKAYMEGRSGIPKVFLIRPDQTVAWIGHPGKLGPILKDALADGLDTDRLKALKPVEDALDQALRSRNVDMIAEAADAVLAIEPWHQKALPIRVYVAKKKNDVAGARAVYRAIPAAEISVDVAHRLAESMLQDPDLPYRFPSVAASLVERVHKAEPASSETLVLMARLRYVSGRIQDAIVLQKQAADLDEAAKPVLDYYRQIAGMAGD